MSIEIRNERTGAILANNARRADNFWLRLKGLLGKSHLPAGEALVIIPCNSVHCIGMRFSIDVVYVTRAGVVTHLIPAMAPGQLGKLVRGTRAVIELPTGTIAASGTQVGDQLHIDTPL